MAEFRELQAAIDAIIAMERHDFEEDHFPDAEHAYNDGLVAAMNAVAAVPAADVAEVWHGRWVISFNFETCTYDAICSNCDRFVIPAEDIPIYKYCPNCGVRKDGDGE